MPVSDVTGMFYNFGLPSEGTSSAPKTPKDEFLRLLVAQLQNQDPLSPQEGAEFVAQLAQFASVEQLAESNNRLLAIEAAQAASARAGYSELVGRVVSARTDAIDLPLGNGEDGPILSAHLSGPASKVEVVIKDSSGREVRRLDLGTRGKGDVDVAWDGLDGNGIALPNGRYSVEIVATGADGTSPVSAYAQLKGRVDSLMFEGGSALFRIGSMTVSPADIISVHR